VGGRHPVVPPDEDHCFVVSQVGVFPLGHQQRCWWPSGKTPTWLTTGGIAGEVVIRQPAAAKDPYYRTSRAEKTKTHCN